MYHLPRMMSVDHRIYLDCHATTPVDPRVAKVIMRYMTEEFGNANSSDHVFGDAAEAAVNSAREQVARLVGSRSSQVVFTSGATESINLALTGFVARLRDLGVERPIRVALPPVEHRAVLRICEGLADRGEIELSFFPVDSRARIDLDDVRRICRKGQDLVCLMAANNEVGNLYPLAEAATIAVEAGAFFFTDATQAVGKVPVEFNEWHVDVLALSAHKLYGPKGVGALVLSERFPIQDPFAASSDGLLRGGTPNVSGAAGLGEAARLRSLEMVVDEERIGRLRDRLCNLLMSLVPDVVLNGDQINRLPGNLHVSIKGTPNHALIARVRERLALSTGAACSAGIEAPSHVLLAMGLPSDLTDCAIRFGLGKFTTEDDVMGAAELVRAQVSAVRDALV